MADEKQPETIRVPLSATGEEMAFLAELYKRNQDELWQRLLNRSMQVDQLRAIIPEEK